MSAVSESQGADRSNALDRGRMLARQARAEIEKTGKSGPATDALHRFVMLIFDGFEKAVADACDPLAAAMNAFSASAFLLGAFTGDRPDSDAIWNGSIDKAHMLFRTGASGADLPERDRVLQ